MFSMLLIFTTFSSTVLGSSSEFYKTPRINGFTYEFNSTVTIRNLSTIEARSTIRANTNVPTGYMGGQARLYNSAGSLRTSSTMTYNSQAIKAFVVESPRLTTKGTYYAYSRAQFYNGNGYTSYNGYRSPMRTLSTMNSENELSPEIIELMLQTEYEVNENGQTYGSSFSEFTIGDEPELISAVGINGIEGYVKSNDLAPNPVSIEEALDYADDNSLDIYIPLYDVDGLTVLDQFKLETSFEIID